MLYYGSSQDSEVNRVCNFENVLQGDPNRNFWFQIAVPLKSCISDPTVMDKGYLTTLNKY